MFGDLHRNLILLCGLLWATTTFSQGVIGVVRDVAGPGISDAVVTADVYGPNGFMEFVETTDALGRFIFPDYTGSWTVTVDASSLNAAGYLSVGSASFSITDQERNPRFTTRKLDLSRRVHGILTNAWGVPIEGAFVRASIEENHQTYQTNLITDSDGRFWFAASPAVWQLVTFDSSFPPSRVFPVAAVPVEVTDSEVQVVLVAPSVTASISGVATNLAGVEVRAECEAYGHRYVQTAPVWSPSESFTLPVFNGVWTVSVTNLYGWPGVERLPVPVVVEVTNGSVQVYFSAPPALPQPTLAVRVLLSDGTPLTNASVYVFGDDGFVFGSSVPIPGPRPADPPTTTLLLRAGRWTVGALPNDPDASVFWDVSREVLVSEGGASNLTLVIPAGAFGPSITGQARDHDGQPLAGRQVAFRATEQGTNYNASLVTGSGGAFAVPVPPGRWLVSLSDSVPCPAVASVTVGETDVQVELVSCAPSSRPVVPIPVTIVDEADPPDADFAVSFWNGGGNYCTTGLPGEPLLIPLRQGLWTASLFRNWTMSQDDPYRLLPTLKFQHDESAPSNPTLVARQGTARIEGRLRDAHGRLLTTGYASAWANIGGTNYSVFGQLASGYFSLNVVPGDWEVAASAWRYPTTGIHGGVPLGPRPAPTHADPSPRLLRVTNGVNSCEFIVGELSAFVPLTVSVIREDGSSVEGVAVQVSGDPAGTSFLAASSGVARFNVLPGTNLIWTWWAWQSVAWEELSFPSVVLNLRAGESNHVTLVARAATACVRGTISDVAGHPLPLPVNAWQEVNGTNYFSSACPGSDREFCLPVFPGDWEIAVSEWAANDLGFRSQPGRHVNVPASDPPPAIGFVLEPFTGDFRHGQLSNPVVAPTGEVQLELRTPASLTWRIERSEDLKEWTFLSTVTTINGVARISDGLAVTGHSTFYRAIWVR